MNDTASKKSAAPAVLSLAQLLEQQPPIAPPCLVEPGLLPPQGILFVGGEPKVGKSLLVANLALSLAAGVDRIGFAASQSPRLLQLDPNTLWFTSADKPPATVAPRRKVEKTDIARALAEMGDAARYNQLRDQIMNTTECSKRTAQLAITEARQQGWIVQTNGQYRLPL